VLRLLILAELVACAALGLHEAGHAALVVFLLRGLPCLPGDGFFLEPRGAGLLGFAGEGDRARVVDAEVGLELSRGGLSALIVARLVARALAGPGLGGAEGAEVLPGLDLRAALEQARERARDRERVDADTADGDIGEEEPDADERNGEPDRAGRDGLAEPLASPRVIDRGVADKERQLSFLDVA